ALRLKAGWSIRRVVGTFAGRPAGAGPRRVDMPDFEIVPPRIRPRRLRTTPAMRRLVEETRVAPAELVLPMFVREGLSEPRPIASLHCGGQRSREWLGKVADGADGRGVRESDADGCT